MCFNYEICTLNKFYDEYAAVKTKPSTKSVQRQKTSKSSLCVQWRSGIEFLHLTYHLKHILVSKKERITRKLLSKCLRVWRLPEAFPIRIEQINTYRLWFTFCKHFESELCRSSWKHSFRLLKKKKFTIKMKPIYEINGNVGSKFFFYVCICLGPNSFSFFLYLSRFMFDDRPFDIYHLPFTWNKKRKTFSFFCNYIDSFFIE